MTITEDRIKELENDLSRLKDQIKAAALIQAEKDRLEDEYQRSQKRFRTIFEESILGKKIINDSLQIIKVNKAILRILGYNEDELLGKRITDFAHPDFVAHWKTLQKELWTTNRSSFGLTPACLKKTVQ